MDGHAEGARLPDEEPTAKVPRDPTVEETIEIAYAAAGATSAVFLVEHPEDVMPAEEIAAAVRSLLADHGLRVEEFPGFGSEIKPSGAFEIFGPSTDGEWRWRLVANNQEIVAQSEGYGQKSDAVEGARAAQRVARGALIE